MKRTIKNNKDVIVCSLWKCINSCVVSMNVAVCFVASDYWPDDKEVENEIYPGSKTCRHYEFFKKYSFEERKRISRKWKNDPIKPY